MQCLSFFFLVLGAFVTGCNDGGTPPDVAGQNLADFFAGKKRYIWAHSQPGQPDSIYLFKHIGQGGMTFDSLYPTTLFGISDTGNSAYMQDEYYIADSIVIGYGANANSDSDRIVLLRDSLSVGMRWRASETYRSSNGDTVRIDAEIDAYYPSIHLGSYDYSDVYRASYFPKPLTPVPDRHLQTGSRHVYYYARNVGKVLEYVYAPDSSLLWKNELIEEK